MTKEQAIELLKTSKSEQEWDNAIDVIKSVFGGDYPEWWFFDVILSGLGSQVFASFGKSGDIEIVPIVIE